MQDFFDRRVVSFYITYKNHTPYFEHNQNNPIKQTYSEYKIIKSHYKFLVCAFPYPPSGSCPCQFLSTLSAGSIFHTKSLQCQTTADHMIDLMSCQ